VATFLMIILSLVPIISIVLPAACLIASNDVERVVKQILSAQELEEAMEYASMFGLDNEAVDVDYLELIRVGRKYKAELGAEAIERIARKHREHHNDSNHITMQDNIVRHAYSRRHHVNQVVKECSIIGHMNIANIVFTKMITGGSRDEEQNINDNRAVY
jgi:hypothetical protein